MRSGGPLHRSDGPQLITCGTHRTVERPGVPLPPKPGGGLARWPHGDAPARARRRAAGARRRPRPRGRRARARSCSSPVRRVSARRAWCGLPARRRGRARVLAGACDDLLTPRALGPLRDAAAARPRAAGRGAGRRRPASLVLAAVARRAGRPARADASSWSRTRTGPTSATLDVLRYLGRRIDDLPAVLVLTYRRRRDRPRPPAAAACSGGLRRPGRRLRCRWPGCPRPRWPSWPRGSGRRRHGLYRLHRGNPFFVTEVLAVAGRRGARAPSSTPCWPGCTS